MGSRVNRKLQLIILLVLVSLVGTMSIAYAVLSTTLNINGTAQVQDASWNVHFDNVEVNPGSVTTSNTPIIIDSKTIDFSVVLNNPGEFYKFDVDIINDGSIRYSSEEYKKFIEKNLKGIKLNYIFKENGGVSSARNLGINAAKGKYITFVDSDDTFIFNNLNINSMLNNYDIIYYDIDIYINILFNKKKIFQSHCSLVLYPLIQFFHQQLMPVYS